MLNYLRNYDMGVRNSAILSWKSHLLTELALNVLGPRGMVDGGHGVQALATEGDGVAHLLLVDALKEPV